MTWRGVNLGGWLLLERWMQESLFAGSDAPDEYGLCMHWGAAAERRIRQHRETYLTREDFARLARLGLNAVRIPFGYWLLDAEPPFVSGIEYLDQALCWCEAFGLQAILDLHGAPGGQSVEHHTGRRDHCRWPGDPRERLRTLDLLEALAQRYRGYACVRGVSLLNEPSTAIAASLLNGFYRDAYRRIRRFMSAEQVAIIIAAFPEQRLPEFHGRLRPPAYHNVVTDLHYYQCFGEWFEALDLGRQLAYPLTNRLPELRRAEQRGPAIVGEWSLRLPWSPSDPVRSLPVAHQDEAWRSYGANQLCAYRASRGWFFWSYKAENQPEWSLRDCVERGWLPAHF